MNLKALKHHTKRSISGKKKHSSSLEALYLLTKKDFRLSKGLSNRLKERFFSETQMLLSAGVDLQTVLELATQGNVKNKKLNEIYNLILQKITKGQSLGKAMESTGQFNNFDCYSVIIGENTGELPRVFKKLHSYYTNRISQKRKVTSALSYPVIVLITTAGAVTFMLKLVVPMFADTLLRFGGELPAITKFVIACSRNIGPFLLTIVLIAITFILFYYHNRTNPKLQKLLSRAILKTPVIGKMVKKISLAEYAQAMDLLLSAKVTIEESTELTQKMVKFYPLSQALLKVRNDIIKGMFFHKSLEGQDFFEPSMITLVKIGEEVNQLDRIFEQLSRQYETDLEYQSGILLTVLEPVMILLLAIIVGVILIAMYLPMFKMGSVLH